MKLISPLSHPEPEEIRDESKTSHLKDFIERPQNFAPSARVNQDTEYPFLFEYVFPLRSAPLY